MRALCIVLLALFAGCSGVKEVPQVPAIKPIIEQVEAPIVASQESTKKISGLLDKASKELNQSKLEGLAFKREMERFRKEGMTAQEELDRVWAELNKIEERNLFLELTVQEARDNVADLEKSLAEAEKAANIAVKLSSQKDEQVDLLYENISAYADNLEKEKNKLVKAEKKLASAQTYKRWVLTVAFSLAGFWVLREVVPLAVKAFKPL